MSKFKKYWIKNLKNALHFWFEVPICNWRVISKLMAQKLIWISRNMVLILNIGKFEAFLANLIFENWNFHCLISLLFTAIVVTSQNYLAYMTIGDLMERYSKWNYWQNTLFLRWSQPLDPSGPLWTLRLKFCTSLAPPNKVEISAEMEARNNSIHLSQAQICYKWKVRNLQILC